MTSKLEAFHENNKSSMGTTHLAIIPPGPNLLSDSIVATPILAGDGMGGGGGGDGDVGMGGMEGGGGSGFEFGVDPSTDPELALALRMSMEEEERRQARERADQEAAEKPKLEAVQEEGQGSSVGAVGGDDTGEGKSDKKDDDKMDTA